MSHYSGQDSHILVSSVVHSYIQFALPRPSTFQSGFSAVSRTRCGLVSTRLGLVQHAILRRELRLSLSSHHPLTLCSVKPLVRLDDYVFWATQVETMPWRSHCPNKAPWQWRGLPWTLGENSTTARLELGQDTRCFLLGKDGVKGNENCTGVCILQSRTNIAPYFVVWPALVLIIINSRPYLMQRRIYTIFLLVFCQTVRPIFLKSIINPRNS